jgi:hypothetical protein
MRDPYEQMQQMAERWFKANVRKLMDWPYELGFGFYVDAAGKVGTTPLTQGEEAEVDWADGPEGTINIGGLHTHVGSDAGLSEFDQQEGRKEANKTGRTYVMYVVGPSQMDEGWELNQEEFEPQTMESMTAKNIVDALLEDDSMDSLEAVPNAWTPHAQEMLDVIKQEWIKKYKNNHPLYFPSKKGPHARPYQPKKGNPKWDEEQAKAEAFYAANEADIRARILASLRDRNHPLAVAWRKAFGEKPTGPWPKKGPPDPVHYADYGTGV